MKNTLLCVMAVLVFVIPAVCLAGSEEASREALEKRIEKLQGNVASMSEEARKKLARHLETLRRENEKIREQLDRLASKGSTSWREIKQLLQEVWKSLQDTYDKNLDESQLHKV